MINNNLYAQTKETIILNNSSGDIKIEISPERYSLLKDSVVIKILSQDSVLVKITDDNKKYRLYYKAEIDTIGQISILDIFFRPHLSINEEQYGYFERYFKFRLDENIEDWKTRPFFEFKSKCPFVIGIPIWYSVQGGSVSDLVLSN
jgi:hypothetical protein